MQTPTGLGIRNAGLALLALLAVPALGGWMSRSTHAAAPGAGDPPLLVPWSRIGDIALGESKTRVQREYGSNGHGYHVFVGGQGYYRLHGSKVWVTFDGGRVTEIAFTTPYYRTKSGFGVGSTIPLGPCHRTARARGASTGGMASSGTPGSERSLATAG